MAVKAADAPTPGDANNYGNNGGSGPAYGPLINYATNYTALYLTTSLATNGVAQLILHNTSNAVPYEIISTDSLTTGLTNWTSEGLWLGLPTNTPATIAMGSRTKKLFFRARVWTGEFDHGVPTNGQLFLMVNTNSIYPVINGVTNQLTPFYRNWVMLNPPLYCVNLGYDASDNGFTNSLVNTNPPQGVLKLVGFSPTLTNLCLSYNPLTNINVSSWPALQDLECWHCTNMLSVSITNCPQLSRVCFEAIQYDSQHGILGSLDFTGCPNIADVRAADNRLSNIIFAKGAGPRLWHLCVHDNSVYQLAINVDFSQFPSMSQLWIWNDNFGGPLNLSSVNCPNLSSVQASGNKFTSADFSGQTNLDQIWVWSTDYYNPTLTNLNIAGCSRLRQVEAYNQSLPSSVVDSVLIALDQMGLSTDVADGLEVLLDGGRNEAPSVEGRKAAESLKAKGWWVSFTPPPVGTP